MEWTYNTKNGTLVAKHHGYEARLRGGTTYPYLTWFSIHRTATGEKIFEAYRTSAVVAKKDAGDMLLALYRPSGLSFRSALVAVFVQAARDLMERYGEHMFNEGYDAGARDCQRDHDNAYRAGA